MHPVQGGLERTRCDLTAAARRRRTTSPWSAAYAEANPDRPWVLGGGWAMPAFGPTGPDRGRPGRGGRRTGRCSCPTATTTAPG